MNASIYIEDEITYADGSHVEIIVWRLPSATADRPHGFKYRLNCHSACGETIVRYDNKTGKGDHKHLAGVELPYVFRSVEGLLADFFADVAAEGGRG